ncbi:hypothetical protein RND71_004762 [Anisodus tanguticus]|uniref:TF-B3 domain-containing protein n=1 Tax=Anisodus tanguticus TaxID=243964 RepID=A0AAE1SQ50_9SOLA|nr:hypothetical protein RND71_004762 [Anisodus tanguticus]
MAKGLINKKCGVIIGDERQRPWNLRLATHDCQVHVVGGWGKFRVANDLKEGDHLMFEVVANGEKSIWKFHTITDLRLKTVDVTALKSQVAASTSIDANPHFISTIRPYTIKNPVLVLADESDLEDGDSKKDTVLADKSKNIYSKTNSFMYPFDGVPANIEEQYVIGQFRHFRNGRALELSILYHVMPSKLVILVIELVATTLVNMRANNCQMEQLRLKTSNVTTPKSQVAAPESADANPHFISTIKPYSITKPDLVNILGWIPSVAKAIDKKMKRLRDGQGNEH